jgi:hypothetical protein
MADMTAEAQDDTNNILEMIDFITRQGSRYTAMPKSRCHIAFLTRMEIHQTKSATNEDDTTLDLTFETLSLEYATLLLKTKTPISSYLKGLPAKYFHISLTRTDDLFNVLSIKDSKELPEGSWWALQLQPVLRSENDKDENMTSGAMTHPLEGLCPPGDSDDDFAFRNYILLEGVCLGVPKADSYKVTMDKPPHEPKTTDEYLLRAIDLFSFGGKKKLLDGLIQKRPTLGAE